MIVLDDTRQWVNLIYDKSRSYEGNTPRILSAVADLWVGVVNDHLSWELFDYQAFEEPFSGLGNDATCGVLHAVSYSNDWKLTESYCYDFQNDAGKDARACLSCFVAFVRSLRR